MTIAQAIDHLTYCSYRAQRDAGMAAERLARFSPWKESARLFERKYIAETKPKGMFVTVIKVKKAKRGEDLPMVA